MKKLNDDSVALSDIKKTKKMCLATSKSVMMLSALVTSALLITACQSTNLSQSKSLSADNTPSAAKAALATALQQQRRQSFAYHSNIEIVNQQQFTDIDSTQLAVSEEVDSYCDDTHDNAYSELLLKAQADNKDIAALDYDTQRDALKQSYLVCTDAYQAWRDNHYDSTAYSVDESAEDIVDAIAAEEAMATSVPASDMDSASEASVANVSITPVSPYYEKLFNEYDSKQTKLDVKKSQLLDAYLLQPLSMNAQGVYQPLAGKFTMLGSVQYSARNHHSSINQPIYVDFKTGSLYLWADNFALLTSKLADDKLGTKWQNKWLKIALDDGTLPKGFGRAVVKSHIEAGDRVYAKAAMSQFDFIALNMLTALSPKLTEQQLAPMLNSAKIIRRVRSNAEDEQAYKDYMDTFYQLITQQYPELIIKSSSNTQDDAYPADGKITSKWLVQQGLEKMKDFADDKNLKTQESSLTELTSPTLSSGLPVQELYGFSKSGQLQWQHSRHYLPTKESTEATAQNSFIIDALNQYMPIRAQDKAFPNLPSDSQVPNASNSIDLKQYSAELAEYYRQGNGTAMGKMLFNVLPMYKQRFSTID
ncbi:hypothetical protein [Psychrobacter sp. DAB_AL32B]|uniref:hypothetical protein n=1 Tax=Psychrobacter sp. DAB_AL32B TaxID=1028414 RepID=UPI000B7CA125|nr:hypothetical protein [Psychrobacter sp. DAB_AL32B]OXL26435.1 hypothetical protein CAN34_03205 [Psychrobacter sp. DAB_AL32B]